MIGTRIYTLSWNLVIFIKNSLAVLVLIHLKVNNKFFFPFKPGKSNKKSKDVRSITRIIVNEKDTNELLITKDIDKKD